MVETDPRFEGFFAEAPAWRAELSALRTLLRETSGIEEVWKWRAPCYTCAGGNTAMLAGLKAQCVLSFFKGVLLPDPEGLLVPPGPNSRSARYVAFHGVDEIREWEPALRALLSKAAEIDRAGQRVAFPQDDIALPEELEEVLAADPDLAAAFEALTPGRQRGYAIHVSGAKKPETRFARIAKHAPRILAARGCRTARRVSAEAPCASLGTAVFVPPEAGHGVVAGPGGLRSPIPFRARVSRRSIEDSRPAVDGTSR